MGGDVHADGEAADYHRGTPGFREGGDDACTPVFSVGAHVPCSDYRDRGPAVEQQPGRGGSAYIQQNRGVGAFKQQLWIGFVADTHERAALRAQLLVGFRRGVETAAGHPASESASGAEEREKFFAGKFEQGAGGAEGRDYVPGYLRLLSENVIQRYRADDVESLFVHLS